jgi:hypothetical protein
MKNIEIKTIEHKGIKVTVQINYDTNEISLVERQTPIYVAKKWVFAGRGNEFMNSWLQILEAMQVAVKQAQKDMQEHLDKKNKEVEKVLIEMAKDDFKNKKYVQKKA